MMKKSQQVDQLGQRVKFNFPPQRIISLVPSQTELLFDLGLNHRVVGITKFCVHPHEWFESKKKIGGTKKFQFEIIDSLNPDLVIGNKEENYAEGISQLAARFPVWMSDIASWNSALDMIRSVGRLVDEEVKADHLVQRIQTKFDEMEPCPAAKVLYLIWKKPWMAAGKGTFIDTMLSKIGFVNCIDKDRYPELSAGEMNGLSPEIILLPTEPFPFQQKHVDELQVIFPKGKVIVVDGEMFSWYGSRLLMAPDYFSSIGL